MAHAIAALREIGLHLAAPLSAFSTSPRTVAW
jgi:hypothetical protein